MIPHMSWANRWRIAWAVLRGKAYVDALGPTGWGQRIVLRTVENEHIYREDS